VLLVSGDISRRTGGNLYDRRMERACRRAGVPLRIVPIVSTAQARSSLARLRPRVVVIDSIAIALCAPLLRFMGIELGARVVVLMHMRTEARGTRAVLRAADRVVAVSPSLGSALGVPRSRLVVIPPGSDGIPVVRAAGATVGALRVITVANWSRNKGIATLVAAVAQVPEVRLDLVGDNSTAKYREAIIARIRTRKLAARVVVHGVLDERSLARRYALADVFALPTDREGYGTVFAEALAHGLPVIAADIPSVRAIVGAAGVFVPPRRVAPLAAALRLMTDAWLRRRLRAAARRRAQALPGWADSQAAFVRLIRSEMRAAAGR